MQHKTHAPIYTSKIPRSTLLSIGLQEAKLLSSPIPPIDTLRDCVPIHGLMGKKLFSIAMINGKVANPAFKMLETKDSSPLAALRAELHERFEPASDNAQPFHPAEIHAAASTSIQSSLIKQKESERINKGGRM
jgi:hypothetical protein